LLNWLVLPRGYEARGSFFEKIRYHEIRCIVQEVGIFGW